MRARSLYFLLRGIVGALGIFGWVRVIRQQKQLQALDFVRQRVEFLQAENDRLAGALAERQRAADLTEERRQREVIEQSWLN